VSFVEFLPLAKKCQKDVLQLAACVSAADDGSESNADKHKKSSKERGKVLEQRVAQTPMQRTSGAGTFFSSTNLTATVSRCGNKFGVSENLLRGYTWAWATAPRTRAERQLKNSSGGPSFRSKCSLENEAPNFG